MHTRVCLTVVPFSALMEDALGTTRVSNDEEEDEDTVPCGCDSDVCCI